MTKKEHNAGFIEFSLEKMNHQPSQQLLDAQWQLAKATGVSDRPVGELKIALNLEWENGGKQLFNEKKASRN